MKLPAAFKLCIKARCCGNTQFTAASTMHQKFCVISTINSDHLKIHRMNILKIKQASHAWVVRLSWLENDYSRPHFGEESRSDWPGFWHVIRFH